MQQKIILSISKNNEYLSMEKKLSIAQYAERLGLTRQAILYRIDNNLELPDVICFEKVGRAYVITILAPQ